MQEQNLQGSSKHGRGKMNSKSPEKFEKAKHNDKGIDKSPLKLSNCRFFRQ